jgi:hypothetical protein
MTAFGPPESVKMVNPACQRDKVTRHACRPSRTATYLSTRIAALENLDGDGSGTVTLALSQVEDPEQAANPVWHVRAHWSVTAPRAGRSFSADLEGWIGKHAWAG